MKSILDFSFYRRYLAYFPNEFRTGTHENVVVSVHGFINPVIINITLYDANNENKQFLSKLFTIQPGMFYKLLVSLSIY